MKEVSNIFMSKFLKSSLALLTWTKLLINRHVKLCSLSSPYFPTIFFKVSRGLWMNIYYAIRNSNMVKTFWGKVG